MFQVAWGIRTETERSARESETVQRPVQSAARTSEPGKGNTAQSIHIYKLVTVMFGHSYNLSNVVLFGSVLEHFSQFVVNLMGAGEKKKNLGASSSQETNTCPYKN